MTPAGGDMTACCRAVMAAPRGGCRVSRPAAVAQLRVSARPEGVIASVVTSETGCGSHLAPWRLTALRGQRFNITLVDFAHALSPTGSSSAASPVDRHACYAYAVFKVRCTHTHPFSGTTWVGRYQKGKTNLDFTGSRDSEWQWHQLGHMQVCTSLQTDNHATTPPLRFLQAGCPSCRPTNSVKALKVRCTDAKIRGEKRRILRT